MDKDNYCIHYRNLKHIVGHGVKIKKVHNIISFNQKAWLKNTLISILKEENKQNNNLRNNCLN